LRAHWSEGHLYAGDKITRLQYKGYFLVVGSLLDVEVFGRLSDAESYCQEKGYNPDECIKTGDPEVLRQAKEIAGWKVRVLEEQAEILHEMLHKQYAETDRLAKLRDEHERVAKCNHKRNWDREIDQENVIKSIATGGGLYEAWKSVFDRCMYYRQILNVQRP
jgi:hypothetical protein